MGIFSEATSLDPLLYVFGVTAFIKYVIYFTWRNRRPANAEYVGRVAALMLYPVKSMRGIKVEEFSCDYDGPHAKDITDRQWIVSAGDICVSARDVPRLATLQPAENDGVLTIAGPGLDPLNINIQHVRTLNNRKTTQIFGFKIQGLDCGDEAARWLSQYLETPVRLLHFSPDIGYRRVPRLNDVPLLVKDAKEDDNVVYQDFTPFHMAAQESLDDVNSKLDTAVGINRFRPNILCHGSKAFDEDTWKEVFIGDTTFCTLTVTPRCLLTTVDPEQGVKDPNNEPYKTLRTYRKIGNFGAMLGVLPCFGINMTLTRRGTVKVGDPIYVVRGNNIHYPPS